MIPSTPQFWFLVIGQDECLTKIVHFNLKFIRLLVCKFIARKDFHLQAMLLIEQPTPPFHVCKFCNKQLSTRCDPGSHNILSNMPTVATITGQPMQIGSSGTQLTGLVAPVMASLPQVVSWFC